MIRWLILSLLIALCSWILPGVNVDSFWTAMVVSLVIGLINISIRPILIFISLPITIFTLGLFIFVINGVSVYLASIWVDGFTINGFWWGVLFYLIYSLFSIFLLRSSDD